MKAIIPTIILTRPQMPENIGMVARAMQNCGFKKMILVSPREKWPNQKAIDASAKAKNILIKAKLYNSLEDSLKNFNYVVATSARKRFLQKPHFSNFNKINKLFKSNKKIAIVFGPENSGLSNEDLNLCDCIFSIPLAKENQSLNLSHSVLLMIYKWSEKINYFEKTVNYKSNIALKKDFNTFMKFLEKELSKSGYFYSNEKKSSMLNNITSMFLRAHLSNKEIKTLWGMFKTLVNPRKR